ncbi:alpha-galactosidase [Flavihumibacter fluvii]|uniref:alpha-galactosidase n=1 Tax=Flavihumibacter fluvii TaxID=2838157 RepID=UPI001BDF4256|nr:alpha-galactosidase [Flavihumibacter fluvii]ULQ51966.1 alpha-galactosidase [Flavihumibacter fluvii]
MPKIKFNHISRILGIGILLILLSIGRAVAQQGKVMPSLRVDVRQWVKQQFAKGRIPPFSFVYGNRKSGIFIRDWQFREEKLLSTDPTTEKYAFTYSDKKSGLVVRCDVNCFDEFQAVEWTLHFSNRSATDTTAVISQLAASDYTLTYKQKGETVLYHSRGSDGKRSDFEPLMSSVKAGSSIYMTPPGGRSSEGNAFPFFNMVTPDQSGVIAAIGWTGKWYADIRQINSQAVQLKAGMENVSLYLLPGETIRSPKICLMFWQGQDRMVGHNQFRKLVLNHYTRKINGKVPQLPLASFLDREGPVPCNEHVCATESHSIAEIKRLEQFHILPEVFWLDAGWYPCGGSWPNVGNWTPNKENFPNGLKPVSDAAQAVGSKFLLWFEPERVSKDKPYITLDKEHPDWLTAAPGKPYLLLNLGNINAREWMTDHISSMIAAQGIDYYRQDFNIDPGPYWKQMDAPGRTGLAEIRHIEGLYAFWDSLLARFPGLVIDNCASGGRRLDLETTARSFPFWRTDYQYGEPIGSQCHTYGLNFYLPLTGTGSFEMSTYHFRSAMSSNLVTDWNVENKQYKLADMQKLVQEFKDLRPYYYFSDYYPLTDTTGLLNDDVWLAYQLSRPELGDGMVMAFRRPQSGAKSIEVRLKGLNPESTYLLTNQDTGEKTTRSGKDLSQGITLSLETAPASLCWVYKKQ